jgi:hypothetical protein
MANERDLELLDDYLANRMSNNDRSAFEHKLNADPNLHQEYELQKHLIQGIKDARVAQLKSMLNQVPVPSHATGNAIASKVLIGAVVTIIIVAAGYWFTDHQSDNAINNSLRQSAQQQQPSSGSKLSNRPRKRTRIKLRRVQSTASLPWLRSPTLSPLPLKKTVIKAKPL